jgi:hypothetical protein
MTLQKSYLQWKQEQRLPVFRLDVTSRDTIFSLKETPTEKALKLAVLLSRQLLKLPE